MSRAPMRSELHSSDVLQKVASTSRRSKVACEARLHFGKRGLGCDGRNLERAIRFLIGRVGGSQMALEILPRIRGP